MEELLIKNGYYKYGEYANSNNEIESFLNITHHFSTLNKKLIIVQTIHETNFIRSYYYENSI